MQLKNLENFEIKTWQKVKNSKYYLGTYHSKYYISIYSINLPIISFIPQSFISFIIAIFVECDQEWKQMKQNKTFEKML